MNNSLPPFYVGQEIVRIKDSPFGKIGDEHICLGLIKCPNCGDWKIDIGLVDGFDGKGKCRVCNGFYEAGKIWWGRASSFASKIPPMQEVTYEKIREQEPVSAN